jgi:cell pole-organizing protein PopZ
MLKLRDFAAGLNPMKDAASRQVRPQAPEAVLADVDLRPSLPEADKSSEPPKASVVTLIQPTPNHVESRMKVASLAFRAPAFSPPPARNEQPLPRPTPAPTSAPAPVRETPVEAPVAQVRAAAPPVAPAAEPVPDPQLREEKAESALLSPASGAKIGASFEALAESLLLRDPQMVERVTREMLRPMLKAWLDDNLPIVVERLVRAEIERVARGRD